MELLEGETLDDRLRAGALPVRKAIEIAIQIARGLAAAHDKGLVHRDLKPANVFLTTAGHVKILDFGLARGAAPVESTAQSETRAALTDAGMVVGTVGYMAPEQVRGRQVDARADLFALGLVVHEMLTGQRAFQRETPAETMTAILKDDAPELSSQRADVNPAIDRIVRHCLEKDPNDRFQSARDVAFALGSLSGSETRAATPSSGPIAAAPAPHLITGERLAWTAVTIALAAAALLMWRSTPPSSDAFAAPHIATLLLPEGVRVSTVPTPGRRLAIAPDGSRIAFVGASVSTGTQIWVQSLRETTARVIPGTDNASTPAFSPDGRILAFSNGGRMFKVELDSNGPPVAFGPAPGPIYWSRDEDGKDLILTVLDGADGTALLRLDPQSGAPTVLRAPAAGARQNYNYPTLLPDKQHLLFVYFDIPDPSTYGYYVGALGSTNKTQLIQTVGDIDGLNATYASGYMLGVRNQQLWARTFDPATLTAGSQRVDFAGPVEVAPRSSAAYAVSANGVLAYQPAWSRNSGRLTVFDRTGHEVGVLGDEGEFSNLELSPDGKSLAISVLDPTTRSRDIWVVDTVRGARTRVTFDPTDERSAVWTADGAGLVYTSKGLELYTKTLGAGAETPFIKDGVSKDPRGWSKDGEYFIYRASGVGTRNDLWVMKRGDDKPRPFLATPFDENYAAFSPDGHFVVYASDESGHSEIYVTSFPSGQGKWPISTGGGSFPIWRRDGKEITYLSPDGQLMSATISVTGTLVNVGTAQALFPVAVLPGPGTPIVMSPDGQRFIVNKALPTGAPPSIVLIYNWPALARPTSGPAKP
jgi:Tol biopolymer transport system component